MCTLRWLAGNPKTDCMTSKSILNYCEDFRWENNTWNFQLINLFTIPNKSEHNARAHRLFAIDLNVRSPPVLILWNWHLVKSLFFYIQTTKCVRVIVWTAYTCLHVGDSLFSVANEISKHQNVSQLLTHLNKTAKKNTGRGIKTPSTTTMRKWQN